MSLNCYVLLHLYFLKRPSNEKFHGSNEKQSNKKSIFSSYLEQRALAIGAIARARVVRLAGIHDANETEASGN